MKSIMIRADASVDIGTGHIIRCLTLTDILRRKGAKVVFICSEMKGNLIDFINDKGYVVYKIPKSRDSFQDAKYTIEILKKQQVNLLIVDHYQIDLLWESKVREEINHIKMMVIDDLANRKHDCELLLDQNYFKDYENRYNDFAPANCRKLLGPKYLLLRPEFYEEATHTVETNLVTKDILIFYGGSDPTNETIKALNALEYVDTSEMNIHVVVGLSNENMKKIEETCNNKNYHFYIQINYLAQLMRKADLALGAGGVTMWERCFLGLPSVVTIVAENQKESTEAAADFGAVWNMGWHENVKTVDLVDIINRALAHPEELVETGNRAKELMQSEQKLQTHPVVEAILEVLE